LTQNRKHEGGEMTPMTKKITPAVKADKDPAPAPEAAAVQKLFSDARDAMNAALIERAEEVDSGVARGGSGARLPGRQRRRRAEGGEPGPGGRRPAHDGPRGPRPAALRRRPAAPGGLVGPPEAARHGGPAA